MTLEVIYQVMLVTGVFCAFQWVTDAHLDPYSPWLTGIALAPVSLLLTFINYFIRDRIQTLRLKKLRDNCSSDFMEDVLRSSNF